MLLFSLIVSFRKRGFKRKDYRIDILYLYDA